MTGLKKKKKENRENRKIYRNPVPSPLYSGWEYVQKVAHPEEFDVEKNLHLKKKIINLLEN